MKAALKSTFSLLVLSLACVIPTSAQIQSEVDFATTSPFYVENTKLPAGSYRVTPAGIENVLLIKSKNRQHAVFVEYIPTQSEQPHKQSDVTSRTYGDVEYLNRFWVEGQESGMNVEPTKPEQRAAASAPVEHTIIAVKQ